jgi:hypothetical protein
MRVWLSVGRKTASSEYKRLNALGCLELIVLTHCCNASSTAVSFVALAVFRARIFCLKVNLTNRNSRWLAAQRDENWLDLDCFLEPV